MQDGLSKELRNSLTQESISFISITAFGSGIHSSPPATNVITS